MSLYEKYEFGGFYKAWNCMPDSEFVEKKTNSKYVVGSFMELDLGFCNGVDLFYCDPPWNLGNTKTFYNKAGKTYQFDFHAFLGSFFDTLKKIQPKVAYIEMGNQFAADAILRMKQLYPSVQSWTGTYYRKNPVVYIRGGAADASIDLTGVDDSKSPAVVIDFEKPSSVCDLCVGLGATPRAAFAAGVRFVGSELNHKRLGCAIESIKGIGGVIEKVK